MEELIDFVREDNYDLYGWIVGWSYKGYIIRISLKV